MTASLRRLPRVVAALSALALLATACGGDDTTEDTGTAADTATDAGADATGTATDTGTAAGTATGASVQAADFKACQITDTGGVDDRSFNQTAYAGVQAAEEEFGIEGQVLESQSQADFEPNIQQFLAADCDLIITVGFLLGDATASAAEANPDQKFAIVDFDFTTEDGEDVSFDNVRELTFATDQAAFLAGYVAAAMTETGTVGTYGGINIPTVTIFMDGYLAGVRYYNQQNDADVQVQGWDGEEGLFTGDFENQEQGRQVTEQLLQNNADVIMPVAGPVGLGSGAAMQAAGQGKLIWVDTDGFESASQFSDLMLTSVMKNMDVAVQDTIESAINDSFEGGKYVGTLDNDGVGIAPFHTFEEQVPQEVKDQLDTIREGIVAGDISVDPADYEG